MRIGLSTLVLAFTMSLVPAFAADDKPKEDQPQPAITNAQKHREEFERRREEWKNLSPEEREAKVEEGREKAARVRQEWEKRREEFNRLTPEERLAKRNELKARLEKRLVELRAKQTNGTINADEIRELERREHILRRFQQAPSAPRKAPAIPETPKEPKPD